MSDRSTRGPHSQFAEFDDDTVEVWGGSRPSTITADKTMMDMLIQLAENFDGERITIVDSGGDERTLVFEHEAIPSWAAFGSADEGCFGNLSVEFLRDVRKQMDVGSLANYIHEEHGYKADEAVSYDADVKVGFAGNRVSAEPIQSFNNDENLELVGVHFEERMAMLVLLDDAR